MGLSIDSGSKAVAVATVVAVLVVGLTDWLQGAPPDGVVDLGGVAGLALFALCAAGVAVGPVLGSGRDRTGMATLGWFGVLGLATVASLIADPTYAVLLFAVPLIHIARRWVGPLRRRTIAVVFVLAIGLVAVEDQPWGGTNLEATLVLFIALSITTMLGSVLGRLDEALRSESELARLDEREQLAGELHDSVGHNLLAGSIQLRNAHALWDADPAGARRSIELATRAVDDALVDTRIAVDTVRAHAEPFSLAAALPDLIDRIASPSLAVDLTLRGDVGAVDQVTQITLYRVAQEALTNVVRHANASSVHVEHTMTPTETCLRIADDGSGFDVEVEAATLGLRGLEERLHRVGGRLGLESTLGGGTTLTATVSRGT